MILSTNVTIPEKCVIHQNHDLMINGCCYDADEIKIFPMIKHRPLHILMGQIGKSNQENRGTIVIKVNRLFNNEVFT